MGLSLSSFTDSIFPGLGGIVSGFGSLFAGPQVQQAMQAVPPPPVAPTTDAAAIAAQEKTDMLRRRKGRMADVLTGPLGAGLPQTATKTLLGG